MHRQTSGQAAPTGNFEFAEVRRPIHRERRTCPLVWTPHSGSVGHPSTQHRAWNGLSGVVSCRDHSPLQVQLQKNGRRPAPHCAASHAPPNSENNGLKAWASSRCCNNPSSGSTTTTPTGAALGESVLGSVTCTRGIPGCVLGHDAQCMHHPPETPQPSPHRCRPSRLCAAPCHGPPPGSQAD